METPSGLQYRVIDQGMGCQPTPTADFAVHYAARLASFKFLPLTLSQQGIMASALVDQSPKSLNALGLMLLYLVLVVLNIPFLSLRYSFVQGHQHQHHKCCDWRNVR